MLSNNIIGVCHQNNNDDGKTGVTLHNLGCDNESELYPVVVVWIGEDKKNKGDVIYLENGDDIE